MTPLVFVSVGTDHHPFDRLVGWADRWPRSSSVGGEVFIQRGTSLLPPSAASTDYLGKGQLDDYLEAAAAVVCHGGPSTIMGARGAGIRPIVVPRDPSLGEHVDGHQLAFCDHLERYELVWRARTEAQLHELIDAAISDPSTVRLSDDEQADLVGPTIARFGSMVDNLLGRIPPVPSSGRASAV